MLIVLFKKQLAELLFGLLGGKSAKDGRLTLGSLSYLLIGFIIFLLLFRVFYATAYNICQPLCQLGRDWMYFAIMGVMATFVGVTGSMFTANSTIYQAKDNELLLSMPIPMWMIVAVRVAMIYIVSGLFELAVMIPALMAYFAAGNAPIWAILFQLVGVLLLPALAVSISCFIGWVTAMVNARVRRFALLSLFVSLVLVALFYLGFWNLYQFMQQIILNADAFGGVMKIALYPFYQLGLACSGSVVSFVFYVLMMFASIGLVGMIISANFLELATISRAKKKTKTKTKAKVKAKSKAVPKADKTSSQTMALFQKEFRRFISSEVAMMSCGLGSIMMSALGVGCLAAGDFVLEKLMGMPEGQRQSLPLMAMFIVGMMCAMNTISATSISLEGKQFWMLKVLPISPWKIFKAKIALHVAITAGPAVFCVAAFGVAGGVEVSTLIWMVVTIFVFVVYSAMVGLLCNLKYPNFNWTNEAQAVKKNASVIVATLAPWGMVAILAAVCITMRLMGESNEKCLMEATVMLLAVICLLLSMLKKRAKTRFYEL